MMRFTIATIVVGTGLVSAQSISTQCQAALQSILASPDAQCLNPSALVSIALQSSDSSIINPINTWLVGLCSQAACSNATLAAVTTNVTTGCSAELTSLGFQTSDPSTIIGVIQEVYPVARQVVCLKDTSTNQLCVNESLTSIQDSYGTLSVSGVEKLISDIIAGTASLPKNVTCSDCTKASYNIIKASFPEYITSDVSNNFRTECGSSFVDGTNPSDISQTASGSASGPSTTKSGADHLFHFTTAFAGPVSALLIVSSIFVAFA